MINQTQKPGFQDILRTIQLLRQRQPDGVIELRALGSNGRGVISGYFKDDNALVEEALRNEHEVTGTYVTLNPVKPELYVGETDKAKDKAQKTTSDSDIVCLHWLLVDFDPKRLSRTSSTAQEHSAAIEMAKHCRTFLEMKGWPQPVFADSGNGSHLIYPINLPNDNIEKQLLSNCLKTLSFLFSDDIVDVDKSTFNPGQISKLYGTLARKGTSTSERPHRRSSIIDCPEMLQPADRSLLENLAAILPQSNLPREQSSLLRDFNLDEWVLKNNVPIAFSGEWQTGKKWIFKICPWNADHKNQSAYIIQFSNGAIAAGCHHNGCSNNDWHALRQKYEPSWSPKESKKPGNPNENKEHTGAHGKACTDILLAIAEPLILFHSPDQQSYAGIPKNGHIENWPVKSHVLESWLRERYFRETGKSANKLALADAIDTLDARAVHDGPERSVHQRIAPFNDKIYIDIGDDTWSVIEVDKAGWRIQAQSPVAFRRTSHSRSLPI